MEEKVYSNKRIIKNTIGLYFRMLVTMAFGIYSSRIILLELGIVDYGIYNAVGGFVTMFAFINSSLASSTSRFLTFHLGVGNQKELKRLFSQCLSIQVIFALIIFILFEVIGLWFILTQMIIPVERMTAAIWVSQMSLATIIVSIINIPFSASIISHERMFAFAWIAILDAAVQLFIALCLSISTSDKLILFSILTFISILVNELITMIYCFRKFPETNFRLIWDKKIANKILSFAGWSTFGNLSSVMMTQGINTLLNMFFGPAVNTGRGIALKVQGIVTRFVGGFQTALNPQITKTYAAGEINNMHKLIFASSKLSFFLLLLLSLPIIIHAPYILRLWLTIVPDYSVQFFRIIILISFIDALAGPFIIAANATGKIKTYQELVGCCLLLIVPISYVVLRLGAPPISVFIVHLICSSAAQLIRLWLLRKMISISLFQYAQKVIIPIIMVSFCSVVVSIVIFHFFCNQNFAHFILFLILTLLSTLFFVYVLGLNHYEKTMVLKKISHILHRL